MENTEINFKITIPVAVKTGAGWTIETEAGMISGEFGEFGEPILKSENLFLDREFVETLIEHALTV